MALLVDVILAFHARYSSTDSQCSVKNDLFRLIPLDIQHIVVIFLKYNMLW